MDLTANDLTSPLECRSCGKAFSQQNALSYHQRTCLSTQNELRSALEKAKNGWADKREAKRRKLERVDLNAAETGVAGNADTATGAVSRRDVSELTFTPKGPTHT